MHAAVLYQLTCEVVVNLETGTVVAARVDPRSLTGPLRAVSLAGQPDLLEEEQREALALATSEPWPALVLEGEV